MTERTNEGANKPVSDAASTAAGFVPHVVNSDDPAGVLEYWTSRIDKDPNEAKQRIQTVAMQDPSLASGVVYRLAAGMRGVGKAAIAQLATQVLDSKWLLPWLRTDHGLEIDEAVLICRSLFRDVPAFAATLLNDCPETSSNEIAERCAFRAMEIAVRTDDGGRANPQLIRFLRSKNPRIRSRTLSLIMRQATSASTVATWLQDVDGRVRANILESLWPRATEEEVRTLLLHYAESDVPRVAANALVGLYLAQDPNAPASLRRMLSSEDFAMRRSAAWAMGATGDQTFREPLEQILRGGDVEMRGPTLRALVALKRAASRAAEKEKDAPQMLTEEEEILRNGVSAWNEWRRTTTNRMPVLDLLDFSRQNLMGIDFSFCSCRDTNFDSAQLQLADFFGADLRGANFHRANLSRTDLRASETDENSIFRHSIRSGTADFGMDLATFPGSASSSSTAEVA